MLLIRIVRVKMQGQRDILILDDFSEQPGLYMGTEERDGVLEDMEEGPYREAKFETAGSREK